MKILHNKITGNHNVNSDMEGPYRTSEFLETVTADDLAPFKTTASQCIIAAHSARYVQKIKGACKSKNEVAEVPLTPASYEAMTASTALAIMAARDSSFAITRPPGHHASKEKAGGFCFFNNIAIATLDLLQQAERVCIIDIDGHHGNGTQAIFKNSNRVFYASIHQESTYPYSGRPADIGKGPSYKKVINIAVPEGSGDDVFITCLKFLTGYIKQFNPVRIAISAGFDGYSKDKILGLNYSKRGYYEAGRIIASLEIPTFAVLEGGYHSEVKSCAEAFIAGINGDVENTGEKLSVSSPACINNVESTLKRIAALFQ